MKINKNSLQARIKNLSSQKGVLSNVIRKRQNITLIKIKEKIVSLTIVLHYNN